MCGPAGSEKSTMACRLEADGMVRLSFDQEAWDRGIRHMPLSDDAHRDVEDHLRRRLFELIGEERDAVLDFSFWSRAMRDDWRRLLEPHGIVPETMYLATDRTTCLERVAARAHAHGDDFALNPETAAAYFDHFEPPSSDGGPMKLVVT
ncbi:AAA family ATPase [Specibacter sp. AOP5-B1-6]|uniref:AAA family ATPase n=1 Tax=Specibacter sp. AOP5-B1-6 TaxID=3457653 RepID=UPI00402B0E48